MALQTPGAPPMGHAHYAQYQTTAERQAEASRQKAQAYWRRQIEEEQLRQAEVSGQQEAEAKAIRQQRDDDARNEPASKRYPEKSR